MKIRLFNKIIFANLLKIAKVTAGTTSFEKLIHVRSTIRIKKYKVA